MTNRSTVGRPATMCAAFQETVRRYPDEIALRTSGDAVTLTWRQYADRVRAIAAGLAGLGVGSGDTVAIMLTNRPEFHLCDTAILHIGATPFSTYNTNPAEAIAYQFENAGNRVIICERQFLPTVLAARKLGGRVEHVVCVDDPGEQESGGAAVGVLGLDQVVAAPAGDFDFDAAWRTVGADDLLTIVYTSGTTGPPKGVELTHRNFIENARVAAEFDGLSPTDRIISYLPDAHAANRWLAHYSSMLFGVQITTVSDMKVILTALTEVRPTVFLGVPRVWVKLKAALESAIEDDPSPVRKHLARWAIGVGRARARAASAGRPLGALDAVRYALADRLVLSRVRTRLGLDRLRMGVTGAAPIPAEVHEFVLGLGLLLCEGWGMSECTAAISLNRPERIKLGTVGTPVPGAEVRIAADGELLVRGPMVMRGYRNDPEKTAETVDSDGWLHTGDIGEIDDEGYIKIVDRKKELIINAAGKNMSPANIENALTAHGPLIGTAVAIGEQRPYNVALICLDPEAAAAFAAKHSLPDTSLATLSTHPRVREALQSGIDAANAKLSRVEQIKKFAVLQEIWEPGSQHLTPTNKLKRKPIATDYASLIDDLYR
ncbi:AMP-dependent synthetase/ligase [Nocardia sp. NBC_01327]|uniref:AMP-dependent synthetase/ligase n=1 Tax=Nocardia sp. NBC_01327 TaxID=2903593 RepID=UPI002E15268A|nr:AMP-dependent synthetase/ligase [Nocardia sp. NBC_01327]